MSFQQQMTEKEISDSFQRIMDGKLFEEKLCGADIEHYQNIDTLRSMIDKLDALISECKRSLTAMKQANVKNYELLEAMGEITDQRTYLSDAKGDLTEGCFFSSLDDVWGSDMANFDNADVKTFNREISVERDERYRKTGDGAENEDFVVIHGAPSSVGSVNNNKICIFGATDDDAQSAHLMPHSSQCATCWFHLVPWVLDDRSDNIQDGQLKWNYMQKCIHGFAKRRSENSVIPSENSEKPSEPKKSRHDQQKTENESTSKATANSTGSRRVSTVGIKHFPSNRISLTGQKTYFDDYNCVLIVPILKATEVKNWSGGGYDAIVLCSKYKNNAGVEFPASKVYQKIVAFEGPLLFATEKECDDACVLLKSMIVCLCKSFMTTFEIGIVYTNIYAMQPNIAVDKAIASLTEAWSELNPQLNEHAMEHDDSKEREMITKDAPKNQAIPIPIRQSKNGTNGININVRKVRFRASDDLRENQSPAPDPVLLLAKAASNWLKLKGLPLLPGCGDDSSVESSNYILTHSEEAVIRGWNTVKNKKPRVDEISFGRCQTFDESLSDDEEYEYITSKKN